MSRHLLLPLCGACFVGIISWLQFSPATADDSPAAKEADSATASGTGYRLAYKFHTGDSVGYETIHKVKFISQFKGMEEVATNCTETKKRYKVTEVLPDGSAKVQLIIEWVRMKVNFGGDDPGVEFDSKDPAANIPKQFSNVAKIVGHPQATLLCSANGKVIKILERSTPGAGGSSDVQLKDVSAQDDFSFLTIFPETPLKIGDKWSEKSEVKVTVDEKLQQTIDLKRTYKLDSVAGNLATVSFRTVILTPNLTPAMEIQLIQRETSGKLVFDMDRGAVVTRTVDTNKKLIKPVGDNTAMHAASHLLERLLTETAELTDAPKAAAKK